MPFAADLLSEVVDPLGVCVAPKGEDELQRAEKGVLFEILHAKADVSILLLCRSSVPRSASPQAA